MRARGSPSCLPEGTSPGGAKASNRFPALDPERAYINVQYTISQGPARHECTSQIQGRKVPRVIRVFVAIRETNRYRIGAWRYCPGYVFSRRYVCVHKGYSHLACSSHSIQILPLPASNNAYSLTVDLSHIGRGQTRCHECMGCNVTQQSDKYTDFFSS